MDRLIGFDPQLLHDAVLTGINIFILFFCLSYLLFNPVRDVLERRKKKIADELALAAGDMADASALKEEYETKLKNVNKEAEASRIVERANREIELEKKKAIDGLKQDVVNIAALMAQKAVGSSIDMTIQNALIDETLKEMGESTWQS